jgi:hypothetical protein
LKDKADVLFVLVSTPAKLPSVLEATMWEFPSCTFVIALCEVHVELALLAVHAVFVLCTARGW